MARHLEADYKTSPLYQFALRTGLWRHYKTFRGIYRTYVGGIATGYDSDKYWNSYYELDTVHDATTINLGKDPISTKIHYNSIENIILSYFHKNGLPLHDISVPDIGSGAGHWLNFYQEMGARSLVGVEISKTASRALDDAFKDRVNIQILNTTVNQVNFCEAFDLVNAIGVMFHIVDDSLFEKSVMNLARAVKPGGHLIVGGAFGLLDNLNVQFDKEGQVTKRLRSYRHWKRLLGPSFSSRRVTNRSYRLVNATLPEANLLFARKLTEFRNDSGRT